MDSLLNASNYNEQSAYISSEQISFSKIKNDKDIQFEIKRNYFDPDKHSPPSIWKSRLMERIEMHINNKKCNDN